MTNDNLSVHTFIRHSSFVIRHLYLLASLFAPASLCLAQQRPLLTDDAQVVPFGRVRAEFGIEFLQGQRYSLSGLEGDLTRLGVVSAHVGVGELAEFQISGVVQDFLSVTRRTPPVIAPDFAGNATSDVGDLVLATKLKLMREKERRPALAFKVSVQLPNASNESGLGADETNFFASLLLEKHFGRVRGLANIGLAILGSPVTPNSQTDLMTYGLAFVVPVHRKVNFVTEIHGRQGAERLGNENHSQARFGAQILAGGLRWDLAAIAGLKRLDADTGVAIGVTYEFQAFGKKRSIKTIK
jgi:hypothetical protein